MCVFHYVQSTMPSVSFHRKNYIGLCVLWIINNCVGNDNKVYLKTKRLFGCILGWCHVNVEI